MRVRDVLQVADAFGLKLGEKGRHSYKMTRGELVAPVPGHDGLASEMDTATVRAMCRRLNISYDDLVRAVGHA